MLGLIVKGSENGCKEGSAAAFMATGQWHGTRREKGRSCVMEFSVIVHTSSNTVRRISQLQL